MNLKKKNNFKVRFNGKYGKTRGKKTEIDYFILFHFLKLLFSFCKLFSREIFFYSISL